MSKLETCIKFGELGARVIIDDEEIPHYDIYIDSAKKEVSCWIASEAGKVRDFFFAIDVLFSCSSNKSRSLRLYG